MIISMIFSDFLWRNHPTETQKKNPLIGILFLIIFLFLFLVLTKPQKYYIMFTSYGKGGVGNDARAAKALRFG